MDYLPPLPTFYHFTALEEFVNTFFGIFGTILYLIFVLILLDSILILFLTWKRLRKFYKVDTLPHGQG
jgi:hypothetical protein